MHHNTSAAYCHASDLELFRTAVLACSQIDGLYLICNLGRPELGQIGTGHFIPVGGYDQESGKVLLMETARYKYPPHWVDLEMLYNAMNSRCTSGG